ncbi:MAG: hypothetical protein VKJ24_21335 [Synechococcales bacterium]|nr:hypothetical protein [Synechococcales bacterium]
MNRSQYPNHLFFVKIGSQNQNLETTPYWLINSDRCIPLGNGYRPVATIAALPKASVKPADLRLFQPQQNYPELRNRNWQIDRQGTALVNAKLEKQLIISQPSIPKPFSTVILQEGKLLEERFQITLLNSKQLQLKSLGAPSAPPYGLILPVLGLGILGAVFWQRRKPHPPSNSQSNSQSNS